MKSKRLLSLPPYLFEELENRYEAAVSSGRDVIDLSIGDPDLDPPASLKANLSRILDRKRHHRYPPQRGLPELKAAVRKFLSKHHGVSPADDEMLILIGSKEGICHLPLALCNPMDKVLVPDPGYPVYTSAALFAGCEALSFRLEEANSFLPDFESIEKGEIEGAKLCFVNYPNNPTSAVVPGKFFEDALDFTSRNGIVLANDAAYADLYFDSKPQVLCSVQGALQEKVIEFFSFSKMFCITGWRIGFAVGNRDIIEALAHLKANIDSGVFGAIQEAVAATLRHEGDAYVKSVRESFRARRDKALEVMQKLGFQCFPPHATFYLWVRVPQPCSSMEFALMLLEKADVLVTPGSGFGSGGEGFFRVALTCSNQRLEEAGERIRRVA